jgi:hypothetical protein
MKQKVPNAAPIPEFEQSISEMSNEQKQNVDNHFSKAKEPEDRWIAVTPETMPEQMDMNVLLLHKTYGVFQGYLMQFGEQWASVRYSGKVPYQLNEVSHWMPTTAIPLPSAPITEK